MRRMLLAARNGDGGWPYRPGKRSRLEPTCWALLALGRMDGSMPDTAPLRTWPRQNGWLVDVLGAPPNHAFNGIAALTMLHAKPTRSLAEPIITRLVASKGLRVAQQKHVRQDNGLQAWAWLDGTFSWVEPTAWCLLLLKQRLACGPLPGSEDRIRVAEQMLADRACRVGGWNYGNSHVYGQDLWPYVPTTALALLALQDRRHDPLVIRALEQLQRDVLTEPSAAAVALSIICLTVHGLSTRNLERNLLSLMLDRVNGLGEEDDLLGATMALYAIADPARPMTAFTIGCV